MARMRLENVDFAYGSVTAVGDVSFDLQAGKFYGIVGPNGAGKSTLLKLLNRFLTPDRGSVFLEGRNLKEYTLRELAQKVALIPQTEPALAFTVEEMVLLARTPYSFRWQKPSPLDLKIAAASMKATEVEHLARRLAGELSGGERQRVSLARVFAQDTDLLLLDEPTAYLDLEHQIKVSRLLKGKAEQGKTCVGVFHDLNLVSRYCDYVFVLAQGSLIRAGEPGEVLTPELIRSIYNVPVVSLQHPQTGRPVLIP